MAQKVVELLLILEQNEFKHPCIDAWLHGSIGKPRQQVGWLRDFGMVQVLLSDGLRIAFKSDTKGKGKRTKLGFIGK